MARSFNHPTQLALLPEPQAALSAFTQAFRERMGEAMIGLCEGTGQETPHAPEAARLPCPECQRPAPVRSEGWRTFFLSHLPAST